MKKLFIYVMILFLALFPFAVVHAQSTNDASTNQSSNTSNIRDVSTYDISGKVSKMDGNTITLQDDNNNTKELTIPSNVKITRDNSQVSINDIKLNDKITATVDSSTNSVVSVSANSDKLASALPWIIGAIALALLLVGLYTFFLQKSKQGHIKTSVQKIGV